jgi:hypothetical protein
MLTPAVADARMGGTTDPIDGARALLTQIPTARPTAASVSYEATPERALLARFDRQSTYESSWVAIVERTPERALLGR